MQNSIQLNSDILKKVRKENGHTQDSIATLLNKNVRQVKRIEKNGRTSLTTAKLLSIAFELTVEQLQGKEPLTGNSFPDYFCAKKNWYNEKWVDDDFNQGILLNGPCLISHYIKDDIKEANNLKDVYLSQYKKVARITENKEQKEHIIEVETISLSDSKTIKLDRYIIRPFKFIKSGIKWCEQLSWDKDNLQRHIEQQLSTCVTDLITEDLPEVTDPQYCIHIYPQGTDKENKQYQQQLLKEQNKLFINQDELVINSAFKDTLRTLNTINHYFPNSDPLGPFYFKDERDLRVISGGLLWAMKPSNMKLHTDNNSTSILFETNFDNEEKRNFLIEFSRVSQSQNRRLLWPEENREVFIEGFIKWVSDELGEPGPDDYKIRITKEGIEEFMQFCGVTV